MARIHPRVVSAALRQRRAPRRAVRDAAGRDRRGHRLDRARDAARARPGAAPVPRPVGDRDAPARPDGHARDRDGPEPARLLLPAVRRAGLVRPAVAGPHHVLHQLRGDRGPGAGGRDGPATRGGRARPGCVGPRGVPLRDAADHPARRGRRGHSWRSRCPSTTTSSARSTRAWGRRRCRCTSTARSSSA